MISTVKLNATVFDYNCVGNGKKVLTVSVLDGMYLVRRSNSTTLRKLWGGQSPGKRKGKENYQTFSRTGHEILSW